jgi:hypothetical protein
MHPRPASPTIPQLLALAVLALGFCTAGLAQQPSDLSRRAPALAADYGKLPLSFEANQGQTDPQVKFLSRGNGYALFLTDQAAVLSLTKVDPAPKVGAPFKPSVGLSGKQPVPRPNQTRTDIVRMELAGSRPHLRVEGTNQLPGTANYFLGNDPSKWHSSVPTYAKVKYASVYPGVDLLYYGNQRQLEYDFVVGPGADPSQVKLHFAGAERLKLTPDGDLRVAAKNGEIVFHKPVVYQRKGGQPGGGERVNESASQREPVEGRFVLLAGKTVGFRVGSYDKGRELVIDPTLTYLTYLGGSGYQGCCGDSANGIAVDSAGNAYVTGITASADFPVVNAYQQKVKVSPNRSPGNAFVTKLNPTGTALMYSTYLGGSGDYWYRDSGRGIAVDGSGHAYVTGYTGSTDFPVTKATGAYQVANNAASKNGARTAFVTKLSADGSSLVYSTFLGGSGYNSGVSVDGDSGNGIALDPAGHAFIVGTTFSSDFPFTPGAYQRVNKSGTNTYRSNAFVTKLNAEGTALDFSTYLGGSGASSHYKGSDYGWGIAVDGNGDVYVTGSTDSKDFPLTSNAYQNMLRSVSIDYASGSNAFVTKLNSTGTALIYSTYLGGTNSDHGSGENPYYGDVGFGVAVDPSCSIYIAGRAASYDFPITSGSLQTANPQSNISEASGFVSKLKADGTAPEYSTYLGGASRGGLAIGDYATGIAVDAHGHAYIVGETQSTDFPHSADAAQPSLLDTNGSRSGNAFITELDDAGSGVVYSSYLGGSGNSAGGDIGSAIAIDASGNAYIDGQTYSHDLAVTPGAFQTENNAYVAKNGSATNAFVAKLGIGSGVVVEPTTTSLTSDANPSGEDGKVTFTAFVQVNDAPCAFPPTGTVSFSIDGGAAIPVALDDTGHAAYATSTLAPGKHTVEASYSGDMKDAASTTSPLTETILSTIATAVTLSSTPNPSNSGQAVTFAATVTAAQGATPTGTVNFYQGGTLLGSGTLVGGVATFTTSTLPAATLSIIAVYAGSSVDDGSTSAPLSQIVRSTTTTTLTSMPNPSTQGEAVTFTAMVKATAGATPTGTVSFMHSTTVLGTATLTAGVATFATTTLPVATQSITAVYSGSATDEASTSAVDSQTVLYATTTALTSAPNPSTVGEAVTFTATVAASAGPVPSGTVDFYHSTTLLGSGTLAGGVATFTTSTLPQTTLSIHAVYLGHSEDAGSTSAVVKQVVNK